MLPPIEYPPTFPNPTAPSSGTPPPWYWSRCQGADQTGIGYTYADGATARLINDMLAEVVEGRDAMATSANWLAMVRAIRNLGRPGISSMAIAAVDNALWDLKARIIGLPLVTLLGAARESVAVYGSGGFTSYDDERLRKQLSGWAEQGIPRVKMKVGREPHKDLDRVAAAREAIGSNVELFVDANGAYTRKQALELANRFRDLRVSWFEEPVSSDDLEGLHFLRDRAPAGMQIAAGEYGYDLPYFERMLAAEQSTSCRPMLPAARVSPAFFRWRRFVRHARCHSRHIAVHRCTLIHVAPRARCAISNISTIMCASSICCSTAR